MDLRKQWKRLTRNDYLSYFFLLIFFPLVISWHYYKNDAIKLILISVLSAFCFDLIFNGIISKNYLKVKATNDIALSIYMGVCTAVMLPKSAPFWFPIIGLFFAYAFAFVFSPLLSKLLKMSNDIHIMQAGAAITFLSFFKPMFSYAPKSILEDDFIFEQIGTLPSLAHILKTGEFPSVGMYSKTDILTGAVAGPIGTSCAIIFIAVLLFLIMRKPSFAIAPLGFLSAASVWALAFPRHDISHFASLGYEISAGMLFFAAVFLLPLPKFLPKNNVFKLIYGGLCGLLTMLFRRFGVWEEAVCAAMLIMNFTIILFDTFLDDVYKRSLANKHKHSR